jgi:adenine-specific DNA methylase
MKKKIIITQLLYNIEKVSSIYFLFTVWKKKLTKRKEKKLRRKFFFENILKGKKN